MKKLRRPRMSNKYCVQCKKVVSPHRKINIGTILLCLLTMGIWIFFIPFYAKKCPQCLGTKFGKTPDNYYKDEETKELDVLTKINQLYELKESGAISEDDYREMKGNLLEKV